MESGVAEQVIDDEALSLILEKAEFIGRPVDDGGLGDPQAMNILLLLAFTGRRINEILMLDFDPLLPLGWEGGTDKDREWFVTKLRYQQTKIRQGPDTIPVEAEVVAIIKAQQKWAQEFMVNLTGRHDQPPPRYLFVARRRNHNGARHYPVGSISTLFTKDYRGQDRRPRPGRASDRHLPDPPLPAHPGHHPHQPWHPTASPDALHGPRLPIDDPALRPHRSVDRRASLRPVPESHQRRPAVGHRPTGPLRHDPASDGRRRSDVANGVCLLPPKMACDRGNACLTCPKFATDRAYHDAHVAQLHAISELIEQRQGEFLTKHGAPMSEDNIWLAGRRQEQAALRTIIATLDAQAAEDARPSAAPGQVPKANSQ